MPTQVAMAQLSRPFQIALVAVCLLAGVWLFALQGRSSSTSSPSTAPASAPAAAASSAPAQSAPASTTSSGTTAPGVAGLSRAVAKARGTVASSQQSAKQVEGESADASGASAPQSSSAAAPATNATAPTSTKVTSVTTVHRSAVHKGAVHKTTVHKVTTVHKTPSTTGAAAIPARQRTVEAALAKGDIVVILFWNHHGADDVAVQRALQPLSKSGKKISVQESPAGQVASFGLVTRGVQVYGTPTILIVNKHGQTTTLTGLQDTYSISQAIAEAR
jgi:hypothetical protein